VEFGEKFVAESVADVVEDVLTGRLEVEKFWGLVLGNSKKRSISPL
jgi:hypothetical protein